ncbi:hypothetical protein KCTCHS21_28520 [Cohnella abietis]|uniref:Uncharacterized protein n=1 Tax=Cohnella abietis TaxID=2507935 RepID=A0A3T1D5R8_9BACL|nr:hypothetical protein KCTCHS21_28520 [Cohnella abietis]
MLFGCFWNFEECGTHIKALIVNHIRQKYSKNDIDNRLSKNRTLSRSVLFFITIIEGDVK